MKFSFLSFHCISEIEFRDFVFSSMIIMNGIDFEECLKDSPTYRYVLFFFSSERKDQRYLSLLYHRNQLRQATNHIDMLEDRLEQVKQNKHKLK
jgi:hypothetical protein